MRRYTLHKYITRLVACLMVLALLLPTISTALATETTAPQGTEAPQVNQEPAAAASGICGENLTWSFANGTLTISGSGAMTNFTESAMAPWYHLRGEILRVSLPEGLTTVGNLAFFECAKIKTLVIPGSVTDIGDFAFAGCSGLELLNLGTGLRRIGKCAFSDCYKLVGLILPDSLESIGKKGFYRCESITTLTIPVNVTSLGVSAFAYCGELLSAEIRSNIPKIPEYLFYGCHKLSSVNLSDSTTGISEFAFRDCDNLGAVYYGGTSMTEEEIRESVSKDIPDFVSDGYVGSSSMGGSSSSGTITENPDGTVTRETSTVISGDNSSVSTTITDTQTEDSSSGEVSSEIIVIVGDETGWQEAGDAVDDALSNISQVVANTDSTPIGTEIIVYVQDDMEINHEFIDNLSNRDVTITIITQDGSSWKINTATMQSGSGFYDLRYDIVAGDADLCAELGASSCFRISFWTAAQINSEIMIRIGDQFAMQKATLLQRQKDVTRVQTSVVDMDGNAHFYLGAVDKDTEYFLAINLPGTQEDALVPEKLLSAYGSPELVEPIQYEITGRKSSWNMSFNQVTWIMIGGLTACVIVVGFVMYTLNKRKLAMGYVPDLDEEDYE